MSIKIKSKNAVRIVLEDTASGKTKSIYKTQGYGSVPSEVVLAACNSFEELEFVTGLQKLEGRTPDVVVAYVQTSGIDISRAAKLVEVANIPCFGPADKKKLTAIVLSSQNDEMGKKISERLSTTEAGQAVTSKVGNSLDTTAPVTRTKTLEFENSLHTFLEDFKANYLTSYFDDVSTVKSKEAGEQISKKLSVLCEAVINNLVTHYAVRNLGKSHSQQVQLAEERDNRGVIVVEQVTSMLGDLFMDRMEQLGITEEQLKKESADKVGASLSFLASVHEAKINIQKREQDELAYGNPIARSARAFSNAHADEISSQNQRVYNEEEYLAAVKEYQAAAKALSATLDTLHTARMAIPKSKVDLNAVNMPTVDRNTDKPAFRSFMQAYEAQTHYQTVDEYLASVDVIKKMNLGQVKKLTEELKAINAELTEANKSVMEEFARIVESAGMGA